MAQRVTSEDVRAICDLDPDLTLQPFITTASLLVDEELLAFAYSAARLKQIELYLTAHFCCVFEPRVTQVTAGGDLRTVFEGGAMGQGLRSTKYGQQALALDTSGTLARLAEGGQRADFSVF